MIDSMILALPTDDRWGGGSGAVAIQYALEVVFVPPRGRKIKGFGNESGRQHAAPRRLRRFDDPILSDA
jgi:hypothetical protein